MRCLFRIGLRIFLCGALAVSGCLCAASEIIGANPLQYSTIRIVQTRDRIVVGKQELIAEYHTAVNTLTQKRVVYGVRIRDKFERELYRRDFDIPFKAFAEDAYYNVVVVKPVTGANGAGVAVISILGPTYDVPRRIDVFGVRSGSPTVIGARATEVVPIVTQMANQFVGAEPTGNAIRLGKGDTWTYRYWTGSFYLHIPLVIDWFGTISPVPKQTDFYVEVPVFHRAQGKICVYLKPTTKSNSAYLEITPTSNMRFIRGHGIPSMSGQRLIVRDASIRVEVDGKSGWVMDADSLDVLGLKPSI